MNAPLPEAALRPVPDRSRRRAEVVAALSAALPAHALLWQREDTVPYECDGLTAYREQPLVVALPETEAQVAAVLAICHRLEVPVVARGSGTGLSGGALPDPLGVTLSLAKFNRILAIDRTARTATVQCGVRNLAISEAAAPHGLFYAPDPSSQIACSIGGNVAENSGGVHCLKYGLTLHNVLKVRGFTAEGEPVEFGSDALDAPGLDLIAALIGSEGMLAVVFEVTVKLLPRPETARCIMASFDDVRKAGDAVAAIIAAGLIPAGLEMMDKPMTAAVESFVHAGYDLDAAAILLCESDGTAAAVEHESARMVEVLRALRRDAHRGERRRGAAAALLERTQERLPGERPHQSRLHVHGLDDPAEAPRRHADRDRRDGEQARPALRQRLPRRRRQPASADPVRRQRGRPAPPRRGLRRRDPGALRRDGRHGDRRARRRRREAVVDVRPVLARRARADGRRQARLRSGRAAQSGQGDSRRSCAAPSTGGCT